jgi:hypothetical protein
MGTRSRARNQCSFCAIEAGDTNASVRMACRHSIAPTRPRGMEVVVAPLTRSDVWAHAEAMLSTPGARVLIEGAPGMGKSTLLSRLCARLPDSSTFVVQASEVERGVGFALLGDLLACLPEIFAQLPAPLQAQLRPLVDPTAPISQALDQRLVGAGLALALKTAADPFLVLAVDDLQWVDDESYVCLTYALRRMGAADVRVLAARRPGDRTIPDATVVELPPMSVPELRSTIRDATGRRLPVDTVAALRHAVGGNPMHAIAVAQGLPPDPAPTDVHLPRSLIELVRHDLDALPSATRRALLEVAVPGVLHVGTADTPVALQAAIAADVIERRPGGELRFTHPLLLQAVLETAAPSELDAARRRAAATEVDPIRRALHLADIASKPDEDLAELMERAATAAAARVDITAACALSSRAIQLTPTSSDPSLRWRRTYLAAQYATDLGSLPGWLEQELESASLTATPIHPPWTNTQPFTRPLAD